MPPRAQPQVQESGSSDIRVYALARADGSTLNHAYFSQRHAEMSRPSWAAALGENLRVVSWPVEEDSIVIVDD